MDDYKLTKLINGYYVSERTHTALRALCKKRGSIKMYQLARMIMDEVAEGYYVTYGDSSQTRPGPERK